MKSPAALARRLVVALMLTALGDAAQAASNCPSPEACLAKALDQQWAAYQSYIEGAWAAYREDRAFYEQARKLGDAELIDMTSKRLSASEPAWRYARAMAEAIAAPSMNTYLESSLQRAQSQVDLAQQRVAREQRFLDGYLRTSGPAREAAQRDMQGYAEEQDHMLYVAAIDTVKTVASQAAESALAMARAGRLGPYGETARQLGEQAMLAGNSVQSGLEVAHARNHGDTLKACLEAAGAAGTLVTATARMAQAHALEATIGGAEVYAGLLSITLDTVLLLQNAVLMEDARQRGQELGLHEQRFGERVHKAQVEAARLTRLREHAQQQVDQRRRIAALLESTKEQP